RRHRGSHGHARRRDDPHGDGEGRLVGDHGLHRHRAGVGEYLGRLPGHAPHALYVQEEAALGGRGSAIVSQDLAGLLYLAASVCFIMALKGLSSPESSRAGNLFGMAGMLIAVLTTLVVSVTASVLSYGTIVAGIVVG